MIEIAISKAAGEIGADHAFEIALEIVSVNTLFHAAQGVSVFPSKKIVQTGFKQAIVVLLVHEISIDLIRAKPGNLGCHIAHDTIN